MENHSKKLNVIVIATLCVFVSHALAFNTEMEDYTKKFVTYDDIKALTRNTTGKYLIEVRNREELAETGQIPNSVNVPLPELKAALSGSAEAFEAMYGRDKPEQNAEIIFTCRSGRRALQAAHIANELGYTNLWTYPGSWLEWAAKEGLPS